MRKIEKHMDNLLALYLEDDDLRNHHYQLIDEVFETFPKLKKKYCDAFEKKRHGGIRDDVG